METVASGTMASGHLSEDCGVQTSAQVHRNSRLKLLFLTYHGKAVLAVSDEFWDDISPNFNSTHQFFSKSLTYVPIYSSIDTKVSIE